jgi:AraC family transcriptional regulator
MDPIARALWFIEGNYVRDIELDDIAAAAGVTRFHLTRAFGHTLGRSVMRYLRGRRLSEAARALAGGAPDILGVALDAGYNSHEAFTRAFREEFGLTPDQLRARGDIKHLKLVEPILMQQDSNLQLAEPRFIDAKPMSMVGLSQRYDYDSMDGIPAQWQRFNRYVGSIPDEVSGAAYGVCTNGDDKSMDYVSAVEVREFSLIDKELTRIRIPEQRFAVFAHGGHIAEIRAVFRAIFGSWLPASGYQLADAPTLEKYGPAFDPATGRGGYEIWLPVKS